MRLMSLQMHSATERTYAGQRAALIMRWMKIFISSPCVLQVVLRHSHNAAEIGDEVRGKITEFALRGFRALGVAITDDISHKRECPRSCTLSPCSSANAKLWQEHSS